jgi:hypothetical protein
MFPSGDPHVWLFYADNSYIASRLLWLVGLHLPEGPISAHRTVELYLKSFLVSHGAPVRPGSPAWGHQLDALGEVCRGYSEDFGVEAVRHRLQYFQRYFDFVRYPSDDRMPSDGSGIWFAAEAVLFPLDELVALIRPRVRLTPDLWAKSPLSSLRDASPEIGYQNRALVDGNRHLEQILCTETHSATVVFDQGFHFHRPGC